MKDKSRVIGIVGSRRRDSSVDEAKCCAAFINIHRDGDQLVSGGCPTGGDRFAENIARGLGLTITIHYANWSKGPSAGFQRNTLIARDCDILIAVVASDRKGGTEDTVDKVSRLGKKVILVT